MPSTAVKSPLSRGKTSVPTVGRMRTRVFRFAVKGCPKAAMTSVPVVNVRVVIFDVGLGGGFRFGARRLDPRSLADH